MESVPYRNTKLLVKTIPKNTLLFRITKNPENDTKGIPLEDGTSCITPHFKVFFYPNPFAAQFAFKKYIDEYDENVYVYKLKKDIKVFNLLKPSLYGRRDKTRKRFFLKRCSTVKKGCMPRKFNDYDACFSDTIIQKYPDIIGYIANVGRDTPPIKRSLALPENKEYRKYFHFASDVYDITTVPELAIYPLTSRSSKNLIVQKDEPLDNAYTLFKTFNRKDKKSIFNFLDRHTKFDPNTFYFTYKE
jgi:hypothetical protein